MHDTAQGLDWDLLRRVSRSFYLTLRVLPKAVREPIGLAYLLARTADTVADTDALPADQRLAALGALRARILGEGRDRLDLGRFAPGQASAAEVTLLDQVEDSVGQLERTEPEDRGSIREVLETIISGQDFDLRRFAEASSARLVSLRSDEELNDYTYRVAGCVGEFWTRLCRVHLFPAAPINERQVFEDSVRFGKGLQLVNILRDLPRDLRIGRCYLPADRLAAIGLEPADLLDPAKETRVRPLYDSYVDRAETYLASGWRYTGSLPRSFPRVRLACAWPVLIGIRTTHRLRTGRILSPDSRIRISRSEVRSIILLSLIYLPWESRWLRLFRGPPLG